MANNNSNNRNFAVIFDMDGVIIDSNPVIVKTWNKFFAQHNILLSAEQINQYVFGRTAKDTLQMVFERELSDTEMAGYIEELHKQVAAFYLAESGIVLGITDFVKSLAAHQIPVAIATSSPLANVQAVLNKAELTTYFDIISDAAHARFSKPHPYIYLKTAERLGIDPARCLVFEDSFSGIAAAKAAGMKVIGLSTTHTASELIGDTDEVISDFRDIDAAHVITLMEALPDVATETNQTDDRLLQTLS